MASSEDQSQQGNHTAADEDFDSDFGEEEFDEGKVFKIERAWLGNQGFKMY